MLVINNLHSSAIFSDVLIQPLRKLPVHSEGFGPGTDINFGIGVSMKMT